MCPLMLRGPQTIGELKTNSHRLFEFEDLDDVQYMLQRLGDHEPPLVVSLPRQPGHKEIRYAHLLSGAPETPEPIIRAADNQPSGDLRGRVEALEAEVEALRQEVELLKSPTGR